MLCDVAYIGVKWGVKSAHFNFFILLISTLSDDYSCTRSRQVSPMWPVALSAIILFIYAYFTLTFVQNVCVLHGHYLWAVRVRSSLAVICGKLYEYIIANAVSIVLIQCKCILR